MTEALHDEDGSRRAGRDADMPQRQQTVDARTISAAALRLFAERGYRATTMSDIGAAIGIRGPSLYRHVSSKQVLLGEIMVETMRALIADQQAALDAGGDVSVQLRRIVEAHVRYHAAHREQAFVGNREIENLEQPYRDQVLRLRQTYERGLRTVIERGVPKATSPSWNPGSPRTRFSTWAWASRHGSVRTDRMAPSRSRIPTPTTRSACSPAGGRAMRRSPTHDGTCAAVVSTRTVLVHAYCRPMRAYTSGLVFR